MYDAQPPDCARPPRATCGTNKHAKRTTSSSFEEVVDALLQSRPPGASHRACGELLSRIEDWLLHAQEETVADWAHFAEPCGPDIAEVTDARGRTAVRMRDLTRGRPDGPTPTPPPLDANLEALLRRMRLRLEVFDNRDRW